MAEVLETLATRRSRRSTAGNRMEAALAEMALEDSNKEKDADDDVEFVNDKVEEDVFESDFASTDEEAENQEDLDAGEKAIHEEEKSTRKAARTRFEKHTAAAHAKHKATFNPQAIAPPVKPKPVVKLVETRNNEFASTSGEVIASPRRAGQKRKSQRMHTVRNTTETVSRLKETEEKKASAPKKYKPTTRIYSQSELIRWALDNEEGNIKEHKNYLKNEEEKRKKARVIKMPAVEGPLLRWVSKIEEEKFKVQVDVTPPPPPPPPQPVTNPTFSAYTNYYGAYNYYANYLSQLITTSAAAGNTPATVTTTTTTPAVGNTTTTAATATAAVGKTVATTPTTTATSQTTVSPNDKPQTEGKPMSQVVSQTPTSSSASPVVQPTSPTSTSTSTPTITTQPTAQTNTTVPSSITTNPTPPSIQTLSFTSTPIPATPVTQPTNQAFSTFRVNAPTTSTVPTTYPTYNYYTPTSTNTNISASTFPTTYSRPATTTTASVPTQPVQRQYVEEERTEKVTKNYVVHELGQREGIGKPPWKEMMKSMFGDHVKWDEVRVLSGKGRPMSRVKQRCPITGQVAPYLDPRTGVPFSNVEAYKILSEVLDHGYIWSPELGCYLTRDENTEMQDVI